MDITVRREGIEGQSFPPSISDSGSGTGTGTGTGTLQPGDALVLGGPPSSWTTRVLLSGGDAGDFSHGAQGSQGQPLTLARGAH